MGRAAIFDDPKASGGDLVLDAIVEQHHTVGDVLLETLPGELALATLAGDDGSQAAILDPTEQPPQLGSEDRNVGQSGEQRLDGVEHDPFSADRVDSVSKSNEQPLEVVLTALLDLAPLDMDVVDRDLAIGDEAVELVAERCHVGDEVGGALLEAHEYAGLVVERGPVDEEREGEQRLAAAGSTTDQRWAPGRKAAVCDFVEAVDAGRSLRQQSAARWLTGHAKSLLVRTSHASGTS